MKSKMYDGLFFSVVAVLVALLLWSAYPMQPLSTQVKQPASLPPMPIPPVVAPVAPPLTGYKPNPDGTKKFLQSLDKPTIREAGPDLFKPEEPSRAYQGASKSEDGVFPYRAFVKVYKQRYGTDWECGHQGIGDCVSWGWHHGVAIASAIEFAAGNTAEWDMPATEAIYGGARVEASGLPGDGVRAVGGYADGSYGGVAANWVHSRGGILYRKKYDSFDLSAYSSARAKEWGAYGCGGKGDKGVADDLAKKHPCKRVALVRTFDEAAAAIRSGYPVPVCSSQGFASVRDQNGFCRPSGRWDHCMCFIAVRFDRPGLLCLNSWGTKTVRGPKYPADQPEGSFWVDAGTCNRMLSGEDSFAVSAVDGFPFRPLDNTDWVFNGHFRKLNSLAGN